MTLRELQLHLRACADMPTVVQTLAACPFWHNRQIVNLYSYSADVQIA